MSLEALFVLDQEEWHQTLDTTARIGARLAPDRLRGLHWALRAAMAGLAAIPAQPVLHRYGCFRTLAILVCAATVGAFTRSAVAGGGARSSLRTFATFSPLSSGIAWLNAPTTCLAAFPTVDDRDLLVAVLAVGKCSQELIRLFHARLLLRLVSDGM